jgi:hypothetical protein
MIGRIRGNGWLNLVRIDYEENIIQKFVNHYSADIGFYFAAFLSCGSSDLFQITFAFSDSSGKPEAVQACFHR